ncbi:pentatricopeptide repeat-containing protein At2g44880 [Andrographis paniculata]|uniref:pentatricopeptide repeat-containing protein At2g44880 n=1 Tax=Andrographis paniculata TaxID=175694 RepID=UPI0021E882E5|nr:pentatricopeptide repeat-containing protein At2g44880 [Andrographis paniculata]
MFYSVPTKHNLPQLHAFILRHAHAIGSNLTFHCNTIIKSLLTSAHFPKAIALYAHLRRTAYFVPDNFTFSTLAKCCGLNSSFSHGVGIHGQALRLGFAASNLYVATSLVDMYGKFGRMNCARKVFDEMRERSSVSWTALAAGYVRIGNMASAREVFEATPPEERDTAAYNVMVDGYVKCGMMDAAREMFDVMPVKNVVSWTTMIGGCCSNGDVEGGRALFDTMPARNLCSWNAMIGGYSWNGRPDEAVALFRELVAGGVWEPDNVTVVSVLPAVADLGALDVRDWVYAFVKRKKLDELANVVTALVDTYAKCGEIEKARSIFDEARGRKTCTWNALINGLALNGRAKEALRVFREMRTKGFEPNEITMLGVLSACSHGGLVEEGKRWFDKMGEFGLAPKIEHYGCMVDLLGRAGRLVDAERLIKAMPYEANGIVLSSFLFACGYNNDVPRAEKVVKKVIDLEPSNDGNYIMLRNLYASEKRWRDVDKIKRLMVINGAKKEVGRSAVEIDDVVFEFAAGDDARRKNKNWHWHNNLARRIMDQLKIHMMAKNYSLEADFFKSL